MGLKQEILAARAHAKSFDYHQRSKCKQNLLELMAELYGEGWDPDLEAAEQPQHPSKHPERQAVKTQPADPNFLKLGVFALFVKAVFTLPISSAIVESLFSKYACPLCTPRLAAFRHKGERRQVGPGVGPTPAFSSCIHTGMYGPTCIFWANLTTFSL
jgi:hypothetical protein